VYNLVSAAAAAGVNRSTVLRAIKAGRISAQRDATGGWQIDPAEFHRVFPPLPLPAPTNPQPDQLQVDIQVALLRTWSSSSAGTRKLGKKITGGENKTCGRIVITGARLSRPRNVNYPPRRNLMPE
jgi:hypothetical protein